MAKKIDLSSFDEEVSKDTPVSKKIDLSSFDEEPSQEESFVSDTADAASALATGVGQGATWGLGEEIGSAAITPFAKLMDYIPGTPGYVDTQLREQGFTGEAIAPKDMVDTYKDIRDTSRDYISKVREESPYLVGTGEILGGTVTGGLAGAGALAKGTTLLEKMASGAKMGAAQGAVGGLGYSESDNLKDTIGDIGTGTILGGAIGGAIPAVGAGLKEAGKGANKLASWVADKIKSTEIGETLLDTIEMTKRGKSVIGKKAHEEIIKESKDLVKGKIIPIVKGQDTTLGKAVGKIYKKLENSKNTIDFSKQLNSAEKQVDNLISTKRVATPEQVANLDSLKTLIKDLKKETVKVIPISKKGTPVEETLAILNKKLNKIKANSKEIGERVSFTEPKIDLDNGTITVFDSISGKPITESIKTGITSPIKFQKELVDTPLNVRELRALKEGAGQIGEQARTQGLKVAQKPSFSLASSAGDSINEIADQQGLSQALSSTNKKISAIKEAKDLLPVEISSKIDANTTDKLSQFFRKADVEGISGDELRDRLSSFYSQLENSGVKKDVIDSLRSSVDDVSKRYELSRSAKQVFGFNLLGTGKATAVFTGVGAGKTLNAATKAIQPVKNIANKIGQMTDDQLAKTASSLSSSTVPGVQSLGKQLQHALQQEGTVKNAALWSLSQQPAFREATRQTIDEQESQISEITGLAPTYTGEKDEGRSPDSIGNPRRDVGSLENAHIDKLKDLIAKKESSGRAKVVNKGNYAGKYQFGSQALEDIGYLKPGAYAREGNSAIDNPANFTGKDGVMSKEDYLNNTDTQEKVMNNYLKRNYDLLKRKGVDVDSMSPSDLAGTLSAAHLKGAGGARQLIERGRDSQDAMGTSASSYFRAGKNAIAQLEKDLSRHSKYINSGGSAVESSTAESMMEDINAIDASEDIKDIMRAAVMSGDIPKLREMLAKFKQSQGM